MHVIRLFSVANRNTRLLAVYTRINKCNIVIPYASLEKSICTWFRYFATAYTVFVVNLMGLLIRSMVFLVFFFRLLVFVLFCFFGSTKYTLYPYNFCETRHLKLNNMEKIVAHVYNNTCRHHRRRIFTPLNLN